MIFLDKRNRIIADERQQEGTIDHTPVYIREIVKRALELSSTALILVHNHPSGDPNPSNPFISIGFHDDSPFTWGRPHGFRFLPVLY